MYNKYTGSILPIPICACAYALAGLNLVGIQSSDFLVGRFSPQKWETLNFIFFDLPVLIVFLDRKSRPAVG